MQCNYHTWVTFDCHDGYLHDMDYDYIDHEDTTYPCPKCNTIEYLERAKEDAESISSGSCNNLHYTGTSIWTDSIETCKEIGVDITSILKEYIKTVNALYEDSTGNERYLVKEFKYD